MFENSEINFLCHDIDMILGGGGLQRLVVRLANAKSWSDISCELTTEVVETNFETDVS